MTGAKHCSGGCGTPLHGGYRADGEDGADELFCAQCFMWRECECVCGTVWKHHLEDSKCLYDAGYFRAKHSEPMRTRERKPWPKT